MSLSRTAFLLFFAFLLSTPAHAEGYNAGDACTAAGTLHTKNDASGTYQLVCNGTIWVLSTTLEKTGKVGFGTAAPSGSGTTAVEIVGSGTSSTTTYGSLALSNLHTATGTIGGVLEFKGGGNTLGNITTTSPQGGVSNGRMMFAVQGSSALINYMTLDSTQQTSPYVLTLGNVNGTVNGSMGIYNSNSAATTTGLFLANGKTTVNSNIKLVFGGLDLSSVYAEVGNITGIKTANTTSAISGDLAFSTTNAGTSSEKMRIRSDGNVGIGDTSPDHLLDVAGNIGMNASSYINFGDTDGTTGYGIRDNAGTVECKNSGGAWAACSAGGSPGGSNTQIQFNDSSAFGGDADFVWNKTTNALTVTGDINYTGMITDTSDRRMKENIHFLPANQLQNILGLEPVSFTMKGDTRTELGLIAQDVEPYYPELVQTTPEGTKTMNYIGLIAPMVQAIKEQQQQIHVLEQRLSEVESGACPPPTKGKSPKTYNP